MEIRRIDKSRDNPAVKGDGDTFLIPLDLLPEGIASGEKVKLIIEGTLNISQEEGILEIDKIYPEKSERTDPLQDNIEKGLDIELKINQ